MANLDFEGRVAVVTGAGGGLGAAYAAALATRGASVIVNDLGTTLEGDGADRSRAEKQVDEIRSSGGIAISNFDDVSNEDGAGRLIGQAMDDFGRLDIVINNAGNFIPDVPFEQTTSERFERLWRVHVLGTVNVTRAAWPHLAKGGYGRVINTASSGGYLGIREKYEYDTVKAAIHGLTVTLAFEGAENGIFVNALCPGANTRPLRAMADALPSGTLPDGYFGPAYSTALVAAAAVWLAHESCDANGEIFMAMAGSMTRMLVMETKGIFDPNLTPEHIRDNVERIRAVGDLAGSNLLIPGNAVARGSALVDTFLSSTQSRAGRSQ